MWFTFLFSSLLYRKGMKKKSPAGKFCGAGGR